MSAALRWPVRLGSAERPCGHGKAVVGFHGALSPRLVLRQRGGQKKGCLWRVAMFIVVICMEVLSFILRWNVLLCSLLCSVMHPQRRCSDVHLAARTRAPIRHAHRDIGNARPMPAHSARHTQRTPSTCSRLKPACIFTHLRLLQCHVGASMKSGLCEYQSLGGTRMCKRIHFATC